MLCGCGADQEIAVRVLFTIVRRAARIRNIVSVTSLEVEMNSPEAVMVGARFAAFSPRRRCSLRVVAGLSSGSFVIINECPAGFLCRLNILAPWLLWLLYGPRGHLTHGGARSRRSREIASWQWSPNARVFLIGLTRSFGLLGHRCRTCLPTWSRPLAGGYRCSKSQVWSPGSSDWSRPAPGPTPH
jgi:hypothetical protein